LFRPTKVGLAVSDNNPTRLKNKYRERRGGRKPSSDPQDKKTLQPVATGHPTFGTKDH
jgi:hypothetical protein